VAENPPRPASGGKRSHGPDRRQAELVRVKACAVRKDGQRRRRKPPEGARGCRPDRAGGGPARGRGFGPPSDTKSSRKTHRESGLEWWEGGESTPGPASFQPGAMAFCLIRSGQCSLHNVQHLPPQHASAYYKPRAACAPASCWPPPQRSTSLRISPRPEGATLIPLTSTKRIGDQASHRAGKGRKLHDKRQDEPARDADRKCAQPMARLLALRLWPSRFSHTVAQRGWRPGCLH